MLKHTVLLIGISLVVIPVTRITDAEDRFTEMRQHIRRPVSETRYEERQKTVLTEQVFTELRDAHRSYYLPVTEYRWEPRWHAIWNPFRDPTLAYHWVPKTRWELYTETVHLPVTTRKMVPVQRTVQLPVTTLRIVEEERITRGPTTNTVKPISRSGTAQLARLGLTTAV